MTVTSGRKCAELLRRQDPLGCLARTCLESSAWNSTTCYLTWKISATPRGRLLCRLSPSMPDIEEIESGLWPTPMSYAHGPDSNPPGISKLDCAARPELHKHLWPTPTKQDGENNAPPSQWERNSPPLNVAVHMLPTPTANRGDGLQSHGVNVVSGQLNPEWVEWLMGYPIGHTDSKDSATPSSRKSQPT